MMDVDADAAIPTVYLVVTAVVGSGSSFSSPAAETALDSSVITADVDADVTTITTPVHGFGSLSFSSSVAAATTTVAANSYPRQWVHSEPIGFFNHKCISTVIR